MENENTVELKQGNTACVNFVDSKLDASQKHVNTTYGNYRKPTALAATNIYINADNTRTRASVKPKDLKSGAKKITVETIHISCQSDFPTCGRENLGGIILYSLGNLSTSKIKWKPGYIYVKTIPNIEANKQKSVDEGQIHGTVCRVLLDYQPSDITRANGSLSGFSLTSEKGFVGNSVTCNTKGVYTKDGKSMNNLETKIVKKALEKWRKTKERTFKLEDLV